MTPDPWPAPRSGPLSAEVVLPGSKSLTNRALVLAAVADGTSHVRRPLRSRDSELMAAALGVLGCDVEDTDDGWRITGTTGEARGAAIDVGNAGTVARFLPPLLGLVRGSVRLDGDPAMRRRPLGPLLQALDQLGVPLDRTTGLPLTVSGTGRVRGGHAVIDASSSSQFVSGLLLAAARFDEGLVLTHQGPPVPSGPHLSMTVEALRRVGVDVRDDEPGVWSVLPGRVQPLDAAVEPDLSTAAAYLAAPLVTGGRVTVPGWPAASTQPGMQLPDLLERMGAVVERTDAGLSVGAGDALVGLEADLHEVGELTPVLAALAALAGTPSRLTGIAHLRGHETDRLKALAAELNGLGGDVVELADGLEIRPRPLHGGVLDSYDDHRIAMAWAVLGLGVDGILVRDVATTRKTVPDFVGSWQQMLAS
jgi:3-phosphoshikimate 1-carboxyvinyltransferase